MTRTAAKAALGLVTLALGLGACRDAFRLDETFLAAEGAAVSGGFAAAAMPLPDGLAFRLGGPAALEETLAAEFLRQSHVGDVPRAELEERARRASVRTPMRYDPAANEVRVVADNLERAAIETGADLSGPDLVRGMLLHECGRAYAERRFDLTGRVAASTSVEEVAAIGLLTTGIAQLAARRAAREIGAEGALERATATLGGAMNDEEAEKIERLLALSERAATTWFEEGGEAAIEAALDHPDEALGLSREGRGTGTAAASAPAVRGPLDELVDRFVGTREGLVANRFRVPPKELKASLRFLDEADAGRIAAGVVDDRAVALTKEGEDVPAGGAYFRRHASVEEARFLVETVQAAFEIQEDTRVEPREGDGWSGFFALPAELVATNAESALVSAGRHVPPVQARRLRRRRPRDRARRAGGAGAGVGRLSPDYSCPSRVETTGP